MNGNSGNDGILRVKKLTLNARLPSRGSKLAAGYDLYSAYDYSIPPRGTLLVINRFVMISISFFFDLCSQVQTDIALKIPSGYYGRIAPRSGLALKHSIDVGGGVIDEDYRGNVGIILFNHSDKSFSVSTGDRIAQLVLEKIITPDVIEVDELDQTERGSDGFGSTKI